MTFSIVARSADGESWGVAVASKFLAVGSAVPAAVAGVGAIATQAWANVAYKGQALAHLDDGATASVALQRLLEEDDGPRPPAGRHRRRRRRLRHPHRPRVPGLGGRRSPATASRSRATSWSARRWSRRCRPPGRPRPTDPARAAAARRAAGRRRRRRRQPRPPVGGAVRRQGRRGLRRRRRRVRSTCASTTTQDPLAELERLLDLNEWYLTRRPTRTSGCRSTTRCGPSSRRSPATQGQPSASRPGWAPRTSRCGSGRRLGRPADRRPSPAAQPVSGR